MENCSLPSVSDAAVIAGVETGASLPCRESGGFVWTSPNNMSAMGPDCVKTPLNDMILP